jgi:predicted  nucleic acid-binding Zn-ribbon protein
MILIWTIIASVATLTTVGTVYYAFFRQPNKLKKLNSEINEATVSKHSLVEAIQSLTTDKSKLETDFQSLKSQTDKTKSEWHKLNGLITSGNTELQNIKKDRQNFLTDIQSFKSEIEKLKASISTLTNQVNQTRTDLSGLMTQKEKLQQGVSTLQEQVQQLKKDASNLAERKSDLEKENSHLSLEIAKKKISYGTQLGKYEDEQGDRRSVKHIGYRPNNNFKKDCFPFVSMPQPNSVIKFPRKGRLGQRGFKEPAFEEELKTYFFRQRGLQFFNDRFLFVSDNTRPYEPDFTIIDESENLNLFIDIEIDEPYDGFGRYATHYKGVDDYRNQYFNDRGWMVIRFSEKQVHENPKGCCRLIAEVIRSVNASFTIPQELQNIPTILEEPFWTKVKSEKWEKDKYREKYLGLFPNGFTATTKVVIDTANLFQNNTEKEAEEQVIPSILENEKPKGSINELNRHHRDSRIKFFPEPHIYLIDDNPRTISASTLVKRFFPDFDEEYWSEYKARQQGRAAQEFIDEWETNRRQSADLGTQLHLDIEKYFESNKKIKPVNKKEFNFFLDFYETHLTDKKLYRTEWRIFDDLIYVAGTADMVFKKKDGTYAIYDWKRSKDIKVHNGFNNGIGVCNNISDCNFNHYSLQLNIYKKILEDHYAKPVSEMYFVQLHPNFDTYKVYEVPDFREKVDEMFNEIST